MRRVDVPRYVVEIHKRGATWGESPQTPRDKRYYESRNVVLLTLLLKYGLGLAEVLCGPGVVGIPIHGRLEMGHGVPKVPLSCQHDAKVVMRVGMVRLDLQHPL